VATPRGSRELDGIGDVGDLVEQLEQVRGLVAEVGLDVGQLALFVVIEHRW
jgi:hypothetical protein